jgi:hypothetical protein
MRVVEMYENAAIEVFNDRLLGQISEYHLKYARFCQLQRGSAPREPWEHNQDEACCLCVDAFTIAEVEIVDECDLRLGI